MMIRSRRTTLGTIVEEYVTGILSGKIQHIDVSVPDRLVCMLCLGYDQMIRKYRIRIDQNIIFLALAPFELEHYLLCRTVFPA